MRATKTKIIRIQTDNLNKALQIFLNIFSASRLTPARINVFFAVIIGFVAALGSYAFRWLIVTCEGFCFGNARTGLDGYFSFLGGLDILVIPALGGLIVGPIILRWAREAKGHGVPEVMKAVFVRGGRIRPVVAVVKSIASAITIGSGGSAGSEGPIVQIGASFGSSIGQWFKMPPLRITNFLACGAAGGIAAIFNAPIAGVMFAMEVILGEFEKYSFIYVVLAAVTSSAVSQYLRGNKPIFLIKYYALSSPVELIAVAVLGVLAAIGASAFSVLLSKCEGLFDGWKKVPEFSKPAIGGLLLGILVLSVTVFTGVPGKWVLGVGYETIERSLDGELAMKFLFILLAAKFLATCLTLGSGGSGGVFAPALFMGSMLGGFYGRLIHRLLPNATAPSGLYAVIGMGAFFAGAAHAPITSILILFEMTGYRYTILLPIMTCAVISTLVASLICRDSIYTIKLRQQGIPVDRKKRDPLRAMLAGDIMIKDPQCVPEEMNIATLSALVGTKLHTSLPVMDGSNRLAGLMTYKEIHRALTCGRDPATVRVSEFMNPSPVVAFPDEDCALVFNRMKNSAQGIAPVVKRKDPRKLIGIVTYRHIYEAYQKAITY